LLAAGIAELLRDPAKRRRLGDAARQLIEEEYSAARMTKDYLRVYEEAIAEVKRNRESRAKLSAASQGGAK
jgi:glycosyltransferase involved in cell wall biosynthesis